MIPVSNSVALSVRSTASNGKNSALGWGLSHSDLSSRETLTYAHIGAAGFHAERSTGSAGSASSGPSTYDASVGRNAFQDLLNASAAATAAAQAPAQAPRLAVEGEKKGPTWSVSIEGGRIQLAVNSTAR